jgi:hypothetical protein
MAAALPRETFTADLLARIRAHVAEVETRFAELDDAHLTWKPSSREWSILQCFDHLVLTYDYYRPKLAHALAAPVRTPGQTTYSPSRWGRIYMYFALNPRYSFPTADAITPSSAPEGNLGRQVFADYLAREAELVQVIEHLGDRDLTRTRIPIEKMVQFNLGDVLKILVYHDEVHFLQARRVLAQQE